ncbi:MAG: hypothetical protein ACP5KV_07410, partial [Candidatus Methanomethylicaceae archaeon]
VLRDMKVTFPKNSGGYLTVKVVDAQSGEALGGATIVVKYPGGTKAHTLGEGSDQYTFRIPVSSSVVVVTVRVTKNNYIPWEGEVAVSK